MLSPINVDYDPSNGSWNVFFLEVEITLRAMAEDPVEVWQSLPFGFPTHGQAMAFVQPQLERPMYQEDPISMWYGDLKPGNDLGGSRVRINQLVMVFEDEPKRSDTSKAS